MTDFTHGTKVNTPIRNDGTSDGPGEIVGEKWPAGKDSYYHVALIDRKPTPAGRIIRIYNSNALTAS
jgi:hypothetical protein